MMYLMSDLALARLAALEAYERAVPRLLHALARDVLARELTLAAPDVHALSRALVAEFASEEPVAFVVAREDAARFPSGVLVRVDPRLRAGDLVLEVRDGEIDAPQRVNLHVANEKGPGEVSHVDDKVRHGVALFFASSPMMISSPGCRSPLTISV